MFLRLLLLFTLIPVIELALLLELKGHIGLMATIALVLTTGFAGAALTRSQGTQALHQVRQSMRGGGFPADELLDGVLILAGGLLLLTPGMLTDLVGFSVLIPFSRRRLRDGLKKTIRRRFSNGAVQARYEVH
jgi:UPF0716 protein FxsA